jgi:hypothetical protein
MLAGIVVISLAAAVSSDPVPTCGLGLSIGRQAAVGPGERSHVIARLVNKGPRPLTLVMPGDGSDVGRRTPIIRWSCEPSAFRGQGLCAYINPLRAGEVFTLNVGESRELGEWVRRPSLEPGTYRCRMTYENVPDHPWGGASLTPPHDEDEVRRLRASDSCSARSNEIEVVIKDWKLRRTGR